MKPPIPCPNVAAHTPQPSSYVAWHEWASEMTKTHQSTRCPGCDLFAIWLPITPDTEPDTGREATR